MSKDQIKKIKIPVETVDNWYIGLSYIHSGFKFWKLDNKWPTNVMFDIIDKILEDLIDLQCKNIKNT